MKKNRSRTIRFESYFFIYLFIARLKQEFNQIENARCSYLFLLFSKKENYATFFGRRWEFIPNA